MADFRRADRVKTVSTSEGTGPFTFGPKFDGTFQTPAGETARKEAADKAETEITPT